MAAFLEMRGANLARKQRKGQAFPAQQTFQSISERPGPKGFSNQAKKCVSVRIAIPPEEDAERRLHPRS